MYDFKKLRFENYMTQTELSKKSGVTCSMICNIEKGKLNPSLKTVKRLCEALNVDWHGYYEED